MLERSRAPSSRMRATAPLIGAAIALAIGAWLTWSGIDYARSGCDCNEALFPDWLWIAILALAAACFALALALSLKWLALRRRTLPDS